jgi:hypothetical protein
MPYCSAHIPLQHDQPNPTHVFRTRLVPRIDAAGDGRRAVVVEVVVQRTVAGAEFLFFEEERVVEECEGIEDVEASLVMLVIYTIMQSRFRMLTFFDKINASFISEFSRVLSFASSFSNATSVA